MEGKELFNEDEEFNSKSKKEDDDADDFGLPEIEGSESESETISDPVPDSWENTAEEETFAGAAYESGSDTSEPDYSYNEDPEPAEEEYKSSYYEEEYGQKKSPVGWIILGVIAVIALIGGIFWFMNRETEPEVVALPAPVEQPYVEPEPEPVEEEVVVVEKNVKQPGVYEINEPNGRYYVIVASSVDFDLVHDYAEKLAKQGMVCNILAPRGKKLFHRLSVADYVSLNDASLKSEQLKNSMGEGVWVIRY